MKKLIATLALCLGLGGCIGYDGENGYDICIPYLVAFNGEDPEYRIECKDVDEVPGEVFNWLQHTTLEELCDGEYDDLIREFIPVGGCLIRTQHFCDVMVGSPRLECVAPDPQDCIAPLVRHAVIQMLRDMPECL